MSAQDGTFPGQLSGVFRNKMAAEDPPLDSSWDFKLPLNLKQKNINFFKKVHRK
jgi:hypothetical protein